jgi:TRAP-type uncharacterized transport system fused permease subunit
MIIRGILILAFLFVPAFVIAGVSNPIMLMLIICIAVVAIVMAYIGRQEWLETELAFHERSILIAHRSRTEPIS